jgi:hypothetical protein
LQRKKSASFSYPYQIQGCIASVLRMSRWMSW